MTTFSATTPDGYTGTRTSKTRVYTHARWIKFPEDDRQSIVSWHMTEQAAHTSPFQSAGWKHLPHGVVPVTSDAAPAVEVEPAAPAAVEPAAVEPAAPVDPFGVERHALTFGRSTVRHATHTGKATECGATGAARQIVADGWATVSCKSCLKYIAGVCRERGHQWGSVADGARVCVRCHAPEVEPAAPAAAEPAEVEHVDAELAAAIARPATTFTPITVRRKRVQPAPSVVEVEPAAPAVVHVSRSTAGDVPVPVERDARWWDMSSPAERAAADAAEAVQWWEVTAPSTYTGRGFVVAVQAADSLAAIVAVCNAVGVAREDSHDTTAVPVAGPVAAHSARVLNDPTVDAFFGACVCSWTDDGLPHGDEWSAKRDAHRHVSRARQAERTAAAERRLAAAERDAAAYACQVHGHDVPDDAAVCARCGAAVEVDPAPSAQLAAEVVTLIERAAAVKAAEAEPAAEVVEHAALPEPGTPAVEPVGAGYRATDGVYRTVGYRLAEGALLAWERGEFANIAPDVEPEPAASRRAAITARVTRHHADFWRNRKAGNEQGARGALDLLDAAERELRELDASYPLDVRAYGVDVEHGRVVFVPNCHLFPGTHGYVTIEPDGHEQWHRDRYDAERWLDQRAAL